MKLLSPCPKCGSWDVTIYYQTVTTWETGTVPNDDEHYLFDPKSVDEESHGDDMMNCNDCGEHDMPADIEW